jgi:Ribosomal RNA-processing protein 7 (RRP7) C-terminal domain
MKDFDEGEQLEKIQREKRTREPDEDGFVVVKQRYVVRVIILSVITSSHASHTHTNLVFFVDVCMMEARVNIVGHFRRNELFNHNCISRLKSYVFCYFRSKKKREEEKRGSGAPRERAKKNEKELTNFYKFQIREQKQNKLFDLRKKFDEDREKVAQMKAGRKFKPF